MESCCRDWSAQKLFLTGARLGFGVWLGYAGLFKWFSGAGAFVGYIASEFGKTWSPEPLNIALAWVILVAEPILALWLVSGWRQRSAWVSTAVLMYLLMFGMTLLMKPEVVANWQYFIFCLFCAAWSSDAGDAPQVKQAK